jgi:hypothetical protein
VNVGETKGEGEGGKGEDEEGKANIILSQKELYFVFGACLLAMLLAALDQTIGMSN